MADKLKEAYELARQMDEQQAAVDREEKERVDSFLRTIQMIESSGGKNFNHPTMQSGMHQGHSAAGRYGLMPNTVKEVVGRMEREGYRFPMIGSQAPQSNRDPANLKQIVESNPDKEQRIAEYLAKQVLEKQRGNEERAAYSWLQGHNMTPEQVESKNYQDHDYVKKYNNFKNIKSLLGK